MQNTSLNETDKHPYQQNIPRGATVSTRHKPADVKRGKKDSEKDKGRGSEKKKGKKRRRRGERRIRRKRRERRKRRGRRRRRRRRE